jgi:hypothetical protein
MRTYIKWQKNLTFFLCWKSWSYFPYIIVHSVQLILWCNFTVQFARPGENRRMLVNEIIFKRCCELITLALHTVYNTTVWIMVISIDQQHKPFESCYDQTLMMKLYEQRRQKRFFYFSNFLLLFDCRNVFENISAWR